MRTFKGIEFKLKDGRTVLVDASDMEEERMFLAFGDDGKHQFSMTYAVAEKLHEAVGKWLDFEGAVFDCPKCGGHTRCQWCDGGSVTRSVMRDIEMMDEERRVAE